MNLELAVLLVEFPEDPINLNLCHVAFTKSARTHLFLRLLNEVEERALHRYLTVGVTINEHLISVRLISSLDGQDPLSQIPLLLLVEAVLVILIAKIVDNRLPFLDQRKGCVLHVSEFCLSMRIKRYYFCDGRLLQVLTGNREAVKNFKDRLNNLRQRVGIIRVLVNPVGQDFKSTKL